MDHEQQNGQEAVELTDEQKQALWDEMKARPEGDVQVHAEEAALAPAAAPKAPSVEDLQADIAAMKLQMERQTRNSAGAIGGLQQKLKQHEQSLAEAREALARKSDGPTPDQVTDAARSGAKWEQLKSDYPEWAEAIEEKFGTGGAKGDQDAIRRVEEMAAKKIREAQEEAERRSAQALDAMRYEVVESLHSGWQDLCKTDEFKTWLKRANAESRELANSDRPSDAIKLLNRFKYGADVAPGQQLPPGRTAAEVARERQQRLTNAVTPPRGTAGSASAKSEQDMTDAEYRQYLIARQRSGRGVR
jgi:vacuolar-type H+-ATPase subunit H